MDIIDLRGEEEGVRGRGVLLKELNLKKEISQHLYKRGKKTYKGQIILKLHKPRLIVKCHQLRQAKWK